MYSQAELNDVAPAACSKVNPAPADADPLKLSHPTHQRMSSLATCIGMAAETICVWAAPPCDKASCNRTSCGVDAAAPETSITCMFVPACPLQVAVTTYPDACVAVAFIMHASDEMMEAVETAVQ